MINEDILGFVTDRIAEIADMSKEDIDENCEIVDELCLSSLEIMSVIGDVELQYNIRISGEELSEIRTVGDLVETIQNKTN